MPSLIVGVRFHKAGKIYHFDASKYQDIRIGDYAVVETSRGKQLGEVVCFVDEPITTTEGTLKSIKQIATPRDLVMRQLWKQKEGEVVINCREKVSELGMDGIKIVAAEFSFEGERLTIFYCSETQGKEGIKNLRGAISRMYPRVKVELRQIGPRDVAKIIGGLGACGIPNRCCSMFLVEFCPISIKMAKEQSISLTPSEITGMCARLRCCLSYEYELYKEARKQLPKRGKRVITPLGEGKVVDVYPLQDKIIVELERGIQKEFIKEEIEQWEEI